VSDSYDPTLQEFIKKAADALELGNKVRYDGTYCFMAGPQYESRCECRFLRQIGGDSVGMSTVPEVLVARHCGMMVLGLSLITNKVVLHAGETHHANHQEVLEAVEESGKYVEAIVKYIAQYEVLGQYLEKLPAFVYTPTKTAAGCKCPSTAACAGACGAGCTCGQTPCQCCVTSACAGKCGTGCTCDQPPCKCSVSCECSGTSSCCSKKSNCCSKKSSCCSESSCCDSNCVVATIGLAVIVTGLFFLLKNRK
jgi:hypothetical protein